MPSDDIVISARNLTKTYRLFGHPGDRIKQFFSLGLKQYHRDFTALEDVSFDIRKGETIGIIGRNGSGKSTLLQLICGILKPTSGSVQVNGRVSALLELGAGFNPEFTGRENVYFQGALTGFTRDQIDARFDEIAAFADIDEFIDQPVRTYSSGMFVRLAFATGIHVAPDILIIDEALAVGDQAFQQKCFLYMRKFRDDGGTVLFVSHNTNMVASYCDRVILLDHGKLMQHATPGTVLVAYRRLLDADAMPAAANASATSGKLLFTTATGALPPGSALRHGHTYTLVCETSFGYAAHAVCATARVKLKNGFVLGTFSSHPLDTAGDGAATRTVRLELAFNCILLPGVYTLDCEITGVVDQKVRYLDRLSDHPLTVVADHELPGIGAVSFSPGAPV